MIPPRLGVAAEKVWQATLAGQGIALYPWLENLLAEEKVREEEWVPSLELGAAIYCLHGRFAEGERLARRAVARSLKMGRKHLLYLRALLALARAYHCQGRSDEVEDIWREVGSHFNTQLGAWGAAHAYLFQGAELLGQPVPIAAEWLNDTYSLAQADPFPLWQGNLLWSRGPVAELPLWQPLIYPTPLDHLAAWPRQRQLEREPLLQQVKLWRQSTMQVHWLGASGNAHYTYAMDLKLHCPGREAHWVSVEVAGCGYEVTKAEQVNSNLLVLSSGLPLALPAQAQGSWRIFFRGTSNPVQVGTLALVRVGFSQGPPLQVRIQA